MPARRLGASRISLLRPARRWQRPDPASGGAVSAHARRKLTQAWRRYSVIHPVRASMPLLVVHRRRNGLAGIGRMEKQPISSAATEALAPTRDCTVIVAT